MRHYVVIPLMLIILIFVACAPAPPPSPQAVTITFAAWEYERVYYAPLIEAFHAANPDIRVQFVGRDLATETDE